MSFVVHDPAHMGRQEIDSWAPPHKDGFRLLPESVQGRHKHESVAEGGGSDDQEPHILKHAVYSHSDSPMASGHTGPPSNPKTIRKVTLP